MRRFTILLVIVSLLGFAIPAGATSTPSDVLDWSRGPLLARSSS